MKQNEAVDWYRNFPLFGEFEHHSPSHTTTLIEGTVIVEMFSGIIMDMYGHNQWDTT